MASKHTATEPTTPEPTGTTRDGAPVAADGSGLRRLTDARTMRALAHPVRIALIEALSLAGPMTATEAGEEIGESPTTCSFHLRQLARFGMVEEAGGGKGRARPWRLRNLGFQVDAADDDPEAQIASRALVALARERWLDRLRTWVATKASYPPAWQRAASESEHLFYLTSAELQELSEELRTLLLGRFRERLTDPSLRPAGSLPVELLLWSFPLRAPEGPGPADGRAPAHDETMRYETAR